MRAGRAPRRDVRRRGGVGGMTPPWGAEAPSGGARGGGDQMQGRRAPRRQRARPDSREYGASAALLRSAGRRREVQSVGGGSESVLPPPARPKSDPPHALPAEVPDRAQTAQGRPGGGMRAGRAPRRDVRRRGGVGAASPLGRRHPLRGPPRRRRQIGAPARPGAPRVALLLAGAPRVCRTAQNLQAAPGRYTTAGGPRGAPHPAPVAQNGTPAGDPRTVARWRPNSAGVLRRSDEEEVRP